MFLLLHQVEEQNLKPTLYSLNSQSEGMPVPWSNVRVHLCPGWDNLLWAIYELGINRAQCELNLLFCFPFPGLPLHKGMEFLCPSCEPLQVGIPCLQGQLQLRS